MIVAVVLAAVILIAGLYPEFLRDFRRRHSSGPPPVVRIYRLPDAHPDNDAPLKQAFFQEPFQDLNGAEINLANFRGTPVVVLMFPSFRTEDGQESLLLLERLEKERTGQFQAVVVPIEGADIVRPAIIKDPQNMWFLFRKNGQPNWTLLDRYEGLFWDKDIISEDFPLDPAERHRANPFFLVIDREGTIREKLIDYSAGRPVSIADLEDVLNALLGPPPASPSGAPVGESNGRQSTAGTEENPG